MSCRPLCVVLAVPAGFLSAGVINTPGNVMQVTDNSVEQDRPRGTGAGILPRAHPSQSVFTGCSHTSSKNGIISMSSLCVYILTVSQRIRLYKALFVFPLCNPCPTPRRPFPTCKTSQLRGSRRLQRAIRGGHAGPRQDRQSPRPASCWAGPQQDRQCPRPASCWDPWKVSGTQVTPKLHISGVLTQGSQTPAVSGLCLSPLPARHLSRQQGRPTSPCWSPGTYTA